MTGCRCGLAGGWGLGCHSALGCRWGWSGTIRAGGQRWPRRRTPVRSRSTRPRRGRSRVRPVSATLRRWVTTRQNSSAVALDPVRRVVRPPGPALSAWAVRTPGQLDADRLGGHRTARAAGSRTRSVRTPRSATWRSRAVGSRPHAERVGDVLAVRPGLHQPAGDRRGARPCPGPYHGSRTRGSAAGRRRAGRPASVEPRHGSRGLAGVGTAPRPRRGTGRRRRAARPAAAANAAGSRRRQQRSVVEERQVRDLVADRPALGRGGVRPSRGSGSRGQQGRPALRSPPPGRRRPVAARLASCCCRLVTANHASLPAGGRLSRNAAGPSCASSLR